MSKITVFGANDQKGFNYAINVIFIIFNALNVTLKKMFITNKIHINLFVKAKKKKKTHTHTSINKEKIVQKYYN